jgi:hypothetical protein
MDHVGDSRLRLSGRAQLDAVFAWEQKIEPANPISPRLRTYDVRN